MHTSLSGPKLHLQTQTMATKRMQLAEDQRNKPVCVPFCWTCEGQPICAKGAWVAAGGQ